ncbi:hypothetical protein WCN91_09085 [Pseudoalteromonas sp. YIC-827]|uniref:Uncharacterized protein n=1 Tax=Pseudoalteromonas qingdaonensis TaxID=3131913 RepID=A0ABU9MX52_9GAMM
MRELSLLEINSVEGGSIAREAGQAVGGAIRDLGEALADAAESVIEWWLPIAQEINEHTR